MAIPTLFVAGDAEREVVPDRVVVSVSVQTPVMRTPQEALPRAVEARRRLLDHLAAALPGSAIADGYTVRAFARMPAPMRAGELQDALGELRPEPETRTASVPVRLALVGR